MVENRLNRRSAGRREIAQPLFDFELNQRIVAVEFGLNRRGSHEGELCQAAEVAANGA